MLIVLVFSAVMPLFWPFNFYFIYSERGWLFWLRHIFVLYCSCTYMKRETQWKKLVKGVLRQYNFTTATWLTAIIRPPELRDSKIGKMTTVSIHLPTILLRYRIVPILLWYFEQTSPSRLEVPSKDMQEAPTEDTVVILPWSCWLLFLLGPCSWHCYVDLSLACRLGCCHEPSTALAAPAATASAASVAVTLAGCFPQHNQKGPQTPQESCEGSWNWPDPDPSLPGAPVLRERETIEIEKTERETRRVCSLLFLLLSRPSAYN